MKIGVPKETTEGERRVALVPEVVRKLSGTEGIEVLVQRGAGAGALIPDGAYEEAGATMVDDAAAALAADVVVKVAAPNQQETAALGAETTLIAFLARSPTARASRRSQRPARRASRSRRCRGSAVPSRWTRCPARPTSRATARR